MGSSENWSSLVIAVIGGDEREREIARLAARTGAEVRAFGFPWPDGGIENVTLSGSAEEAMQGAGVALFPIPGLDAKGRLFAPESSVPIEPTPELLGRMSAGAHIVLGFSTPALDAAAAEAGVQLHEYEHDRELMLLRAPAICEGAIQLAIQHTDVTIHASRVGVIGQGTIGSLMTRFLIALGARVTVFARNPEQRAAAYAAGADSLPLTELVDQAAAMQMLFSTVPASVVDDEVLARFAPGSLILDLAAPPGGVDFAAVEAHGLVGVWARGMGRRAPVTVGASQWVGIEREIRSALGFDR